MKIPKVSLIIPVFNFENYISSTLESAFNQTYKNLEIIVVNDGSRDNSAQIVTELQKSHNNLILINQQNKGVSVARNRGIEEATGEYILFSDADDLLSDNYVSYLVNNALLNDADLSIGTGIYTNYKIGNISNSESNSSVSLLSPNEALLRMLTYWYPIGCYCRAYKRNLIEKGLRFIPGQKVGEGFTFNIAAIKLSNKVVVGNKPIYCYRRDNSESCMTKFNISRAKEAVESIEIIRSLFENPSQEIIDALDYAEWHTKGDMFNWMALTNNSKNYPDEYLNYRNSIKRFAIKALRFNVSKKERLRALLQTIHPNLLVQILKFRKNF